jgi:NADH:ubiquinone oxidoreductase subunit F (NADH-binding)
LFATAPSGGWEAESAGISDVGESNPTIVNNVETLAAAAHILGRGAGWFRRLGTDESPGTVIVTVVGDVVAPGVHEVELGTPLSDVLAACGGPRPGRTLRAAFSGVSNPVLPAEDFDVPLSYEGLAERGSGLGAAGFAVYDDTADMVDVARALSRFLAVESCGQCPPCKRESIAITDQLDSIVEGDADDTSLAQIGRSLQLVTDANRCYLGTQEQNVVSSIMRTFPEDFALHLEGSAVSQRRVHVPLVADITEAGEVVYDESHVRKQLDWTYRVVGVDH